MRLVTSHMTMVFGIVEMLLAAEEDHLVADNRRLDRPDGAGVEVAG
jgi:hypothetical protein